MIYSFFFSFFSKLHSLLRLNARLHTGLHERVAAFASLLVSASLLTACGAPNVIGLQGRLTNSAGVPLTGAYSLTVKFFANANGTGAAVYTHTSSIDVADGLFSTGIGQYAMAVTNEMDPAIFAQPLYAQMIVNSEVLTPLVRVTGAPYALSLTPGAVVAGNFTGNTNFAVLSAINSNAGAGGSPVLVLGLPSGGAVDAPFLKACRNDSVTERSCTDPKFIVEADGGVRADGAYTNPAADFAELMLADGDAATYAPGDVLVVSDAQDRAVEKSVDAESTRVIGVYSTRPAFLGGSPMEGAAANHIPVAMAGIVPVKVSAENGAIQRGDLLVAAGAAGHATKAGSDPAPGSVLGRALGMLSSGTGVIEVVLVSH